jgi:hypothetical protein
LRDGPRPSGGLLTWPMAMLRWPDWSVLADVAGSRAAGSPWPESARWRGRPGLISSMSTRIERGSRRAKRMVAQLTKGGQAPMRWRMGRRGGVSSRAVAQSRQRGSPVSSRRRAHWRRLGGPGGEGHQCGARRSEGGTRGRPEQLDDARTSVAGGRC